MTIHPPRSLFIIVAVFSTMFSLTFLLLLYAKHCRRQASASAAGAVGTPARSRSSGVERAVVDSLPLFRFGSLMGGAKEGLECAVCLGRFEPEELLRLLPKCRHAFHVDCVDAWLDFHSTCPLCRSRVRPEDVLLLRRLDPAATAPAPGKRVSGRHSSAGERSSGYAVAVSTERQQRKDMLLLPVTAEAGRYSHRVMFSGRGAPERWSDLRPSDLFYMRPETTDRIGPMVASANRTGATDSCRRGVVK